MVLSLYLLLPYVFEAQFVDGVACFPDTRRIIIVQACFTFFVMWTVCGGLTPLTVSIIVPIVCLCYIRRNVVTEGAWYRKGMARFSLFLVVGAASILQVNPFQPCCHSSLQPQECTSATTLLLSPSCPLGARRGQENCHLWPAVQRCKRTEKFPKSRYQYNNDG